jgi:hypothetical protein
MSTPTEEISKHISEHYPNVKYTVSSGRVLEIPAVGRDGFEIRVQHDGHDFLLQFGDWHFHFDGDAEGQRETIDFLKFGLSKLGRLRVYSRGGKDYKWVFEIKNPDDNVWSTAGTTGRLNLRFWGNQDIRTYQNDLIERK